MSEKDVQKKLLEKLHEIIDLLKESEDKAKKSLEPSVDPPRWLDGGLDDKE